MFNLSKTKGAVSIFLVIILVPMMTVAAAFVDASKVKLGKSMISSAGSLSLNTALTDYDTQLKDLYGLMATAQDTEELFGKLETYFRKSITSTGVSAADAADYTAQIMAQLGLIAESNKADDILNLQLSDFSAKKLDNACLNDATLLKKQLVDFMKYRAPINTGLSFISSLKGFTTLSKQSELVEKKQDYYEAQQTVMEDLKMAWENIAAYNGTDVAKNSSYISNIYDKLHKTYRDDYKLISNQIIMDLYKNSDTINYNYSVSKKSPYLQYTKPDGSTENDDKAFIFIANGSTQKNYSSYTTYKSTNLPDVDDIKSAIEGFFAAAKSAKNSQENEYKKNKVDSDYGLQVLVKAQRSGLTDYSNYEKSVYNKFQALKHAMIWVDGYKDAGKKDSEGHDITPESINDTKITVKNQDGVSETLKISEWYSKAFNVYYDRMNDFSVIANRFTGLSVSTKAQNYTPSLNNVNSKTATISSSLKANVDSLTESSKSLELSIQYLGAAITKLGDLDAAKGAWSGVANDSSIKDTSLAKQDLAEMDQLDNYLNEDNIGKLRDRLSIIKTKVDENIAQIKGYKFYGKSIVDIKNYSDAEAAIANKLGDTALFGVPKNTESLKSTCDSFWSNNGGWKSGGFDKSWANDSDKNPDLTVNKVTMYSYLYSHFGDATAAANNDKSKNTTVKEESESNGKGKVDKIKNTSKSAADTQKDSVDKSGNNDITGFGHADLPSAHPKDGAKETPSCEADTNSDSAAGSASGGLGGLFNTDFLNAIKHFGITLRDDLYVSDYALSMFSYDTIEKEYKEKNNKEPGDGDLLTLTNNPINSTNNYAYRSEVEYIIFGGSNSSAKTKAYASIFAIRFGFNLVYAFATSEIRDSALAIATPISAATLGVIPVPLIQAIIIIGLACAESGIDIYELSEGKTVPLYKSNKTWHCSISGLCKGVASEVAKKVGEVVIDAGIDKLNEYLDMGASELQEVVDSGTGDIEQAVGNVYDQIITENANTAIQELTSYVNSAVDELRMEAGNAYNTKKAELKKRIKNDMSTWGSQFSGDDLASKVKREAANIIVNNSDSMIDGLFDKVESSVKNSSYGTQISTITSGTNSSSGVEQLGGEVMEKITSIRKTITTNINKAGSEVKKYIDDAKTEISEAASKSATDLKNTLNSKIDGMFGTGGSGSDESTGTASFFSFSYKDYLRLFLLIGLITSQEGVILRIGDVIQVNMANLPDGNLEYNLGNSAVYVQINATVMIKPTLLALPLFSDVEKNPKDNSNWYTVKYQNIAGY